MITTVRSTEVSRGGGGHNLMDNHRNVIQLALRSPHFEYVECGAKTVDARIRFDMYRGLRPGDVLKFVKRNSQKFILKNLTSIEKYDNFGDLLRTEGVRSCLPGLQEGDVKAGVKQVCFKYLINLDPSGEYLGKDGDDYGRLQTAVRTLRRRTTKERMIRESNKTKQQVGLRTQIPYFCI